MKQYYLGTTVKISINLSDEPDSITISIKDYTGVKKVDEVSMTRDIAGVYHYLYQSDVNDTYGYYYAIVSAVIEGKTCVAIEPFEMQNQPGGLFR